MVAVTRKIVEEREIGEAEVWLAAVKGQTAKSLPYGKRIILENMGFPANAQEILGQ